MEYKNKKPIIKSVGKDIPNMFDNEMDDVPKVLKKPKKSLIYDTDY